MTDEPIEMFGREYKRDPYELYRKMRDEGPVHRVLFPSGVKAWLVTGYTAAHEALNDDRLGKNHSRGNATWRERAAIMPEPQHSQLQVHLLHQDPPKHTSMRKLVTDGFAPRRIEALRPRLQELADALIDAMPSTPEVSMDLVACFAARFPFQALAEVIGLPPELASRFKREWGKVVAPVGPTDPRRAEYEGLLRGLQGYIAEVVANRRANPGDDLLSKLVGAHAAGELSQAELDSMIFQLLVAGQEPVTNQITTAIMALVRHPEKLAVLAADPSLLPLAVDELLRYDSAFELTTWRFFTEDSDLHGTTIPAGDSVIVSLCAANRDERRFADADELDLTRSPNPHLAFGHGIHFCPGAALARLELQIAIGTLIDRLPGLRLAVPEDKIEWVGAVLARGTTALPVTYTERT
ncbi:putative cytochrome P450 hydroxylase [Alloactinosynnema sp. L-07]|uniref:cytochrome P450 family protein n=1 Tax=Alloactinosynnema sp. L-07 TaxID=1653480 RepID=UPI00065EF27D|nr:cytochrome P450 [Alloactinosynnema sp. L-07]CRK57530.1 putative cytochrome P450 hydroxylase [Alloactinosynnema sp. L-07]